MIFRTNAHLFGVYSMTPDQSKFTKQLVNSFIRALMNRVAWGMPLKVAIGVLALAIAAAYYFKLY